MLSYITTTKICISRDIICDKLVLLLTDAESIHKFTSNDKEIMALIRHENSYRKYVYIGLNKYNYTFLFNVKYFTLNYLNG